VPSGAAERPPAAPGARLWPARGLGLLCAAALGFAAGFVAGRDRARRPDRVIRVDADLLSGLRADHRRRTGRDPTPADEEAAVARHIDGEILYREARARGLDRGDVIIRRRLQQLMDLRAEDAATAAPPTDGELARELEQNPGRYARPARLALTQVFVARGPGDAARAAALLTALDGGADPARLGDPFLRGRDLGPLTRAEASATFGGDFAAALFALPATADGRFVGPVPSSYGLHLVSLRARQAARPATLEEARVEIAADLREHRRAHAREQLLELLRGRYRVERTATGIRP